MADIKMYDDIYFGDTNARYVELAGLSPEKWTLPGGDENGILKSYLIHTYDKLLEEGKVVKEDDFGVFNTGLFDRYDDPIYAYLEKNRAGGAQPYYLKRFGTPYDLGWEGVGDLPERANYFERPELLIFDARCTINVQFRHILNDEGNIERMPESIRNQNLKALLNGAIEAMKKKVSANYKIAVPQYHNGNIQLLLPLCLEKEDKPDMALVVTKNAKGNYYQGHTCITLEMAYNNARLIAKPDSNWLKL